MFKIQLKITKHAKNQGNVNHKPRKTDPTARDQKITRQNTFINMLKDVKQNDMMK